MAVDYNPLAIQVEELGKTVKDNALSKHSEPISSRIEHLDYKKKIT